MTHDYRTFKIEQTGEPVEMGKRLHLPVLVTMACPGCGATVTRDLNDHTLSYPKLNTPFELSMYHGKDKPDGTPCEAEWTVPVILSFTLNLVATADTKPEARPELPDEVAVALPGQRRVIVTLAPEATAQQVRDLLTARKDVTGIVCAMERAGILVVGVQDGADVERLIGELRALPWLASVELEREAGALEGEPETPAERPGPGSYLVQVAIRGFGSDPAGVAERVKRCIETHPTLSARTDSVTATLAPERPGLADDVFPCDHGLRA